MMNKFKKACEMSMNDWLATIPDIVPEAEYTENHEKWLKKLLNKMRDNRYHTFTTKTVKVLLIAATLTALLLTAFVIPSSREFIIDNFDIFSRYQLTESNDNSVNGEITVGFVPDGFKLIGKHINLKSIAYDYGDARGNFITISKTSSSLEMDFDTETGNIENINMNNIHYTYFNDKNNYKCLLWNENDYIYQINGTASKDELLKIAETVK